RIGVILGHDGALMSKLIPLYRSGLGGKLSNGQQWMSWVHVEDVVRFIEFALDSQKVEGVVNLTAPNPVQNIKFNKVLAKFTQRPALFTVPEFALNLTMGEKSYLALSNQRISTKAEKEFGFKFNYPSIESACAEVCNFEKLYGENFEGFHYRLRKSMFLPSPIEHVYDFFARPANLKKVAPSNLKLELIKSSDERLTKNSSFTFKMIKFGVPVRISSKVCDIAENEFFKDVQTSGPFQSWLHSHLFYEVEGGTIVVDDLKYRLPFGLLGDLASSKANKDVEDMFRHRMQSIREYFGESK
ncbi:MAG: DUF1731 domain-containing protein, partial [Bacteriovoracaceae bacterium]|nr:DUF1731 domain-containing protein [Bacteriovoracaceae bacterium]